MKQITLNIPDDYADVLSVTVVGGAGTKTINVTTMVYDITKVVDKEEFDVKAGVQNERN